jgi:hypothetical protein
MFTLFVAWISILPAMIFIWAGFALPVEKEYGELNYEILKMRLNRVLLPTCIIFFVLFFSACIFDMVENSFFDLFFTFTALWGVSYPTFGFFAAVRFSAASLEKRDALTKGSLFLRMFCMAILLKIIGLLGIFLIGGIEGLVMR